MYISIPDHLHAVFGEESSLENYMFDTNVSRHGMLVSLKLNLWQLIFLSTVWIAIVFRY